MHVVHRILSTYLFLSDEHPHVHPDVLVYRVKAVFTAVLARSPGLQS